jgi:peptide/nickel transport system substrate-binding protein
MAAWQEEPGGRQAAGRTGGGVPDSYDRRTFLSKGARTAAGAAVLAGGGSALLDACSSSGSGGNGNATAASTGSGVSTATPKKGGTLTMGVESEVNSFNPTQGRWDPGGILYARAVYDPLTTVAADGSVQPYLAQSVTPSPDFTKWTITLRPNVTFHDGTPLDAGVVKTNLDALTSAFLTGPALTNVAGTAVTGPLTVEVSMKEPWVVFDLYLAGQLGYVVAPSVLNSSSGGTHPVGTGPFVFSDWVPNDHFSATRNPHYWRPGLPYLNQVTFRPITDTQSIDNSLLSGTIDIMHSSNPDTIVAVRGNSGFQLITDANSTVGEPSQDFIMLNTAAPPLDDVRVRQALAYATDKQKIIEITYDNMVQPSNGPFPPGTPWFSNTGYPQYNPTKARQLIDQVKAQKGPVSLQLGTVPSSKDVQRIQLVQAMWQDVGVQVSLTEVQQTQFILNALQGKYQAYTWRQFDTPDPDGNYVWWSVNTAAPIGSSALNFARNKDPQVQSALETGRTQSNPSTRNAAYQSIGHRFAVDVPYIWINKTLWTMAAKNDVQNFNGATLPNGARVLPMSGGYVFLTQTWINS